MNMPGFTAELSLVRKGNHYGQMAPDSRAIPGAIQPALYKDTLLYCQLGCPDGRCVYVCDLGIFCHWVCMKRLKGPIKK